MYTIYIKKIIQRNGDFKKIEDQLDMPHKGWRKITPENNIRKCSPEENTIGATKIEISQRKPWKSRFRLKGSMNRNILNLDE